MKSSRKLMIVIMVFLFSATMLLAGCNTAKKPVTPTPQTTKDTNITTSNAKQVANQCAAEANKVSGVNKATAVVSGKTIYIGLDMNANLEKSKSAEIERTVLNRIKELHPGYTVMVTSDADTVTRIKNVAEGVAQGKPISSFSKELQDIDTRITPKVK